MDDPTVKFVSHPSMPEMVLAHFREMKVARGVCTPKRGRIGQKPKEHSFLTLFIFLKCQANNFSL